MIFLTQLTAIDPADNLLKNYMGPVVEAISWKDAENYVQKNLPYLTVIGIYHGEIDQETGKNKPATHLN